MFPITELRLRNPGESISRAESFGYAQGNKLSVDLIAPLSGVVLFTNSKVLTGTGIDDGFSVISKSPYMNGWLAVVQLTKPDEMQDLLTPETYLMINAKVTG